MFSVIFPGQGSQSVGMGKDLYNNFKYVKDLFSQADDVLNFSLSKLIMDGPKESLELTENTQPAIFLMSYSISEIIKKEFGINLTNAEFFAGHSLGEYSALSVSGSINFEETLKILKTRGHAMQSAVPKGEGGMVAILGSEINTISQILKENEKKYECFIANDNSNGQLVLSGKNDDLNLLLVDLKKKSIKSIKLSVSAPFHCKLMNSATNIMKQEIKNLEVKSPKIKIISNVTAKETQDPMIIKELLIKQIESPVRWRESVINMINNGVRKFIEIGPGKVLSGLVKRIDKNVETFSINSTEDMKFINLND